MVAYARHGAALVPGGLRWRLGGVGGARGARLLGYHVRGRLSRHRQRTAPSDRPGDLRRRERARSGAASPPTIADRAAGGRPRHALHPRSALQARVRRCCSRSWRAPARAPTVRSCLPAARVDNGETAVEQARENRLAASLLRVQRRLLHARSAGRGRPAACGAQLHATRRPARDGRRGRAAWRRWRTRRGASRARSSWPASSRSRRRSGGGLSGGRARVATAAPDGGRRGEGGRGRPAPTHPRRLCARRASCGCSPMPSTTCSTVSPRRSPGSAHSLPTPRTSCARP